MTGLRITGYEAASEGTQKNNMLYDTYFHGQETVLLPQLIGAIRWCDQMLDSLRLGLAYILKSVVICHHKKTLIDLFHLYVVDDIDAFINYPWGRRYFQHIVRVFTRLHSKLKEPYVSTILMN